MEDLWKLGDEGLAGFVKEIGMEMESFLKEKGHCSLDIGSCTKRDQDQSYSLIWEYNRKYTGEVMISRKNYNKFHFPMNYLK